MLLVVIVAATLVAFVLAPSPAAAQAGYDAEIVSVDFPRRMIAGSTYQATIVMRNSGTTTWKEKNDVRLATARSNPFRSGPRVRMPDKKRVRPGRTFRFRFELTAPAQRGRHLTTWRMRGPGGKFGQELTRTIRVKPAPVVEDWLRVARATWPTPQAKRSTSPEIGNVWTFGTHPADLRRLRDHCTTAEIGVFLDWHWDRRIADDPDAAWQWLDTERDWWESAGQFGVQAATRYRKTDAIRLADYAGLHVELNFDSLAGGRRRYHTSRANPELADDQLYGRVVLSVLRAVEDHGVRVHRIWIENEPNYTRAGVTPVFTEATYIRRVRHVARIVRAQFPHVLIGAGGTDPDWGIAAWQTGAVDQVGYHVVNSLRSTPATPAQERDEHLAAIDRFRRAGVPLDRVLADEVNTSRGAANVEAAVDAILGEGIAGVSWVTVSTPTEDGIVFPFSLHHWGMLPAFRRAIARHVRW